MRKLINLVAFIAPVALLGNAAYIVYAVTSIWAHIANVILATIVAISVLFALIVERSAHIAKLVSIWTRIVAFASLKLSRQTERAAQRWSGILEGRPAGQIRKFRKPYQWVKTIGICMIIVALCFLLTSFIYLARQIETVFNESQKIALGSEPSLSNVELHTLKEPEIEIEPSGTVIPLPRVRPQLFVPNQRKVRTPSRSRHLAPELGYGTLAYQRPRTSKGRPLCIVPPIAQLGMPQTWQDCLRLAP